MSKKLLIDNDRLNAMEALKNGFTSNAKECLRHSDLDDRALEMLERGDVEGAFLLLDEEPERRFDQIEYMRAEAGQIKDPDVLAANEKYIKLKQKSAILGKINFKANSIAVLPKDQAKSFYSTSTSGGNLIAATPRFDLMQFKSKVPLIKELLCTIIDDLKPGQTYRILIETNPLSVYNLLEGVAMGAAVDDPQYEDTVEASPYIILSLQDYSRKAIKLFPPQAVEMIKGRSSDAIFRAIGNVLFYGDTSLNQCEGLYSNTDLQKVSGASFTELMAYNMIKRVNENEAEKESRFFVLNAALEEKLKGRPYASSGRRIIEEGLLCDEPYVQSEIIQDGHLWYGAWSTIVIMLYPRELLVDAFSKGPEGGVILKNFQPYFCGVRNIKWICLAENVD